MIWATVSSRSCFCWQYTVSPSLAAKTVIFLISVSSIWWCSCLLLCCWKRVFAMTSAFSWQNSLSLCPASFCTPRPNLPVTPGVSWLPTFAFQSPIMKRTSFWGVSFKKCKSKPLWGTISRQSELLWSKSLQAINAGEGVEKREPSYTVGGNAN